jgi:hypothetical protein
MPAARTAIQSLPVRIKRLSWSSLDGKQCITVLASRTVKVEQVAGNRMDIPVCR